MRAVVASVVCGCSSRCGCRRECRRVAGGGRRWCECGRRRWWHRCICKCIQVANIRLAILFDNRVVSIVWPVVAVVSAAEVSSVTNKLVQVDKVENISWSIRILGGSLIGRWACSIPAIEVSLRRRISVGFGGHVPKLSACSCVHLCASMCGGEGEVHECVCVCVLR